MARRRGSNRSVEFSTPDVFRPVRVRSALQLLEDRRLFHPDGALRAPRSFFTKPRLVISPAKRPMRNGAQFRNLLPTRIGFEKPFGVAVCVRRGIRKEVLHALGFTGRGSGAGRKRRNFWSDVKC